MEQYQVTATYKGYVAAIVFVDAESAKAAIELAQMSIVQKHTSIRAAPVASWSDDHTDKL